MGSKKANRKFSLDSSGYQLEISGVSVKPKHSMLLRRSSEIRSLQSPDETHPEILEHNSSVTRRSTIIEEEGRTRFSVHNSFKNHSRTFRKLFPEIPEDLEHVFTCALHKEVLYHGKMYVSRQHICFHSSVLLKDTKVMIHISSVLTIKKKHTAKIVPNAVAVITDDGHKYVFGSLRNRESCFRLLQSLCPQTEILSRKSSAEHTPEMDCDRISSYSSLEENPENQTIPLNEQTLTDSQIRSSSTTPDSSRNTPEQHTTALSWVSMVTEKVRSSNDTLRLNKLLLFYLILAVLLLLSSGYIGLRIVALEEQLSILGSLPEFTQQKE
ncbi:GRAM domain-containing protein 2B-like isoform X2 [Rhinichthys klamathensis goyatoka]|uniref:GRAM domain-containing protein 2B-like isoform X2 n=1 Tax=Rhinichthys klamathensis goyatoka TaxID=3034132 RepID=UPI0024B4F578|nr:GRAM domain-containing protein 2B-like isoform X2 [Rhinichthys klamathensis goyatoka]